MKALPLACLALLVASLATASSGSAGDAPATPDLAEVLKRIEDALFFPDAQEGLAGYECDVTATEAGRAAAPLAHVRVEAASGTKVWIDAGGAEHPFSPAWAPACGAWRLADLLAIEVELFSMPLSKRFGADRSVCTAVEVADGTRLSLHGGGEILLRAGRDGVPSAGAIHVRGGAMAVLDAAFDLRFESEGSRRRLVAIENTLTSGTMKTRATLRFAYAKQDGFLLPATVTLSAPLADLFDAADLPADRVLESSLTFGNYVVKRTAGAAAKTEPAKPEAPSSEPAKPEPPKPAAETPAGPRPKYVGDKTCLKCHFVQHKSWKKGPLARSLDSLRPTAEASDAPLFAKKKASGLDPAKDYSADAACVKCHVTGYGAPGGYPTDPSADDDAKARAESMGRVSCEACHGPGEAYVAFKQQQAGAGAPVRVERLLPLGLVLPDEKSCRACHNGEGPTKESFNYVEAKFRVHDHKKK